MVDINLPNFVTVGLIAIIAVIAVQTLAKTLNKTSPV